MFRLLVARPVIPSALTIKFAAHSWQTVYQEFAAHLSAGRLSRLGQKVAPQITPDHWMRQMCEPQHSKFVIPNEARDLLLGLKRRKNQCDPVLFR